jgi:L-methionine (R)-S-oxide reductase
MARESGVYAMASVQGYEEVEAEIASLVSGETYTPARLASAACLLAHAFAPRFFWTGFYVVE